MNLPSTVMATSSLQAVTQSRGSKDHTRDPLSYTWRIGISGLLLHSLGLFGSVDNIFTGKTQPGCSGGFNCTEPSPEYEVVLAVLAGGPVGIGDGPYNANADLIAMACTRTGQLLRPSKPLTVTDKALLSTFDTLDELNLWSAFSTVANFHWHFLLNTFSAVPVNVSASDLVVEGGDDRKNNGANRKRSGLYEDDQPQVLYVAYTHRPWVSSNAALQLTLLGGDRQLYMPALPQSKSNPREKVYSLHVVAPVFASGWVLLGELGKVAAVSEQRFKSIEHFNITGTATAPPKTKGGSDDSRDDLVVTLWGSPAELVTVSLLPPGSATVDHLKASSILHIECRIHPKTQDAKLACGFGAAAGYVCDCT